MPLTKYLIHGRVIEGNLTSSTAAQLSFLYERNEVHVVSMLNRLVRVTCYMTKSTTSELFSTLDLDEKGSEQDLNVVYDLISKVILHPTFDD